MTINLKAYNGGGVTGIGYDKLDDTNISITGLSQYNVFCVNTGEVDDDGNPAFLSLSDNILTTSGSFDVTTADGTIYTVTDTLTLDITDYEDGEYNVYVNPVDLTLSIKSHTLTAGSAFPSDAASGDYLLNTSQVPYDLQEITKTTTIDDVTSEEITTITITKGLNEVYAGVLTVSGGTSDDNEDDEDEDFEVQEPSD